jgi:hypothetical protein
MKLDWRPTPNNIGHFYSNGGFRCHDGDYVSPRGQGDPQGLQHTILEQQENAVNISSLPGFEFKHPVDLGDMTAVNCSDCHTGSVGP